MPFWFPPVATSAIAAAVTICVFTLTGRRARDKSKREAGAKFRSAFFAETIAQLDNKDVHALMRQAKAKHDAAIIEFSPFLDPSQVKHFHAAEQQFHQCRSALQPKALKIIAAVNSNRPVDHSDEVNLKEALNQLLAFADKT